MGTGTSRANKPSVTPQQLWRASPLHFGWHFLRHHLKLAPAEFHRVIYRDVAQARGGGMYAYGAPRDHAKTTVASLVVPLWWTCEQHKHFILQLADTSQQAEDYLAAIVHELEENDALREYYGSSIAPAVDRKGQLTAWRDKEITTAGGVTIRAAGAGKSIRGAKKQEHRPDAIIIDDLENDQSVLTAYQRDKLHRWLLDVVLNLGEEGEEGSIDEGTDVFMLGTILHHDSVLARVLADSNWQAQLWRAINDDGSVLWSDKWSPSKLEAKRRKIGSIAFGKEFQNNPTYGDSGIFRDAWLRYVGGEDDDGQLILACPDGAIVFGGFDPAISKKRSADPRALVTVKLAPDGRMYVDEAVHGRWSFREQQAELIARCGNCAALGVESNAYQAVLAQELIWNSTLAVKPIHTSTDKVTRAIQLSVDVENGKVIFDRQRHEELIQQLLDFPHGAHDDLVDALGFAVELAKSAERDVITWV